MNIEPFARARGMFGLGDITAGMGMPMRGRRAAGKSHHVSTQCGSLLDILTDMTVTCIQKATGGRDDHIGLMRPRERILKRGLGSNRVNLTASLCWFL